MTTYTIRRIDAASQAIGEPIKRKQFPAACRALYNAVYDVLSVTGGLDTRWGWAAAFEAKHWGDSEAADFRIDIGSHGYVEILVSA